MTKRPVGWIKDGVDDVRQVARGWRWGKQSVVPRSAEEFVPQTRPTAFRTGWSRTPAARVAREIAQKGGLQPLFRSQVRTRVEGLDVLARVGGPVIFVANHASHLDTPLVLLSLPDEVRRRTAVAAAADYFFDTWIRSVGSAIVFNAFPIDRRSGSMAASPGEVLDEGWNLVIYPEGTRSPDGRLYRGKTGVARMALESGAVVIPCAMVNTEIIQPAGRLLPKFRPRPGVRLGKPLDFSRYEGMAGDRYVERSITDEIMYELMQISGQEYVDQYAASVKRAKGQDTAFGSRDRAVSARETADRIPDTRAS